MDIENGVERLKALALELSDDGVTSREAYRDWRKCHEDMIGNVLGYEQKRGMPAASSLMVPFFVEELGLIGFNYSHTAHNTLHAFEHGWTDTLRLCRGIVFDQTGKLVALPFPKFFNDGEHAETKKVANGPFVARKKMDGHLGIIFHHQHRLFLTTRGDFESRSAKLGRNILDSFGTTHQWQTTMPTNLTVLVEIVHPETRVHIDYGPQRGFVLLGAYDRNHLKDLDDIELEALAAELHLPLPDRWPGTSLTGLRREMRNRSVNDEEGYVARFADGRVKFKYRTYIGKMVGAKLTYAYVMKRIMAGNLRKMITTLPEEGLLLAREMSSHVRRIHRSDKTLREKRKQLYALVPEELRTSSFKATAGKFLRTDLP